MGLSGLSTSNKSSAMNKNSSLFSWQRINKMECDAANGFSSPKIYVNSFQMPQVVGLGTLPEIENTTRIKENRKEGETGFSTTQDHLAFTWYSPDVHMSFTWWPDHHLTNPWTLCKLKCQVRTIWPSPDLTWHSPEVHLTFNWHPAPDHHLTFSWLLPKHM